MGGGRGWGQIGKRVGWGHVNRDGFTVACVVPGGHARTQRRRKGGGLRSGGLDQCNAAVQAVGA